MSMQSQRGRHDGISAHALDCDHGAWPALRELSPTIVASLAGGLRATYEARPDTDMPDAFADLLMRIEAAERTRG